MEEANRKQDQEEKKTSRRALGRIGLRTSRKGRKETSREVVPADKEALTLTEDTGAKVKTSKGAARTSAPVAIIFSCVLVVVVFMYMLSLNVTVEEYSKSISELQTDITRLKEEATQLEVQLESRYDLDEIERIATEQYGMVSADSLSRQYVSVSEGADVMVVQPGEEENGFHTLVTGLVSAIREMLS